MMDFDIKEVMGDLKSFADKLDAEADNNIEKMQAAQIVAVTGISIQLGVLNSEIRDLISTLKKHYSSAPAPEIKQGGG
jgi:hypothetical protein